MYVIAVTFQVSDAGTERFLSLVTENARLSLEREPECHRFDVCVNPDRPGEVVLYEHYADKVAFDEHLRSAHFKVFDENVSDLVE